MKINHSMANLQNQEWIFVESEINDGGEILFVAINHCDMIVYSVLIIMIYESLVNV